MIYMALQNGVPLHIDDAPSGLKCNCVCPACGAPLVARKGKERTAHFAHHSIKDCEFGYETSLHLLAKELISKAEVIWVPPVYLALPHRREELFNWRSVPITKVILEKRFDNIIPDIMVYSGNAYFFIEIVVTHGIDDVKREKIRSANISTLEIDLSDLSEKITPDLLSDILLNQSPQKTWCYNRKANKRYQDLLNKSERKKIIERGLALHVDYCPIKARCWRGKPYANFIDDCIYCKHLIDYKFSDYKDVELNASESEYIMCSGRSEAP